MDNQDIRWIQRFQNFEKAFLLLQETVQIESPSVAERAGFVIKSPRDAIKQAFQANIIIAGHTWIDALEDRNLASHTYHEKIAIEVDGKIRNKYFPVLEELYVDFKNRVDKE